MKKFLPSAATTIASKTTSALKNSTLTDFIKVTKKDINTGSAISKSTPLVEEIKKDSNKRTKKANSKKGFTMPTSFYSTHDHKDGEFKDGKVNIWHWNVNGINAVLSKGNLQEFLD